MALDLVIVKSEGGPTQWASICTDVHVRLISAAQSHQAQLILRMEDYYADATYSFAELQQLLVEINALLTDFGEDVELAQTLRAARGIVEQALKRGCGIEVVAD